MDTAGLRDVVETDGNNAPGHLIEQNGLNGNNGDNGVEEGDALGSTRYLNQHVVASMPTEMRATHYKMSHQNRGIALIFNHENFRIDGLKTRNGTHKDCEDLERHLKRLGFEVHVFKDIDFGELCQHVDTFAKKDHSESDCFLMAVLSHGELGILYARDTPYKPECLWSPFTADKCPTLAGKPKMFFIQACQGDKLDGGVTMCRTETDGQNNSYRIPTQADFLIAYSTVPGYYSWRNTTRGSWFIQALCQELEVNAYKHDLLTLLTFVSQRVALDFESNVPDTPHMHRQKQIPSVTSMLTRLVKFEQTGSDDAVAIDTTEESNKSNSKDKSRKFLGGIFGRNSYSVNHVV